MRKKVIGINFTLQLSHPTVHCNYLSPAENAIEILLTAAWIIGILYITDMKTGKLWNTLLV